MSQVAASMLEVGEVAAFSTVVAHQLGSGTQTSLDMCHALHLLLQVAALRRVWQPASAESVATQFGFALRTVLPAVLAHAATAPAVAAQFWKLLHAVLQGARAWRPRRAQLLALGGSFWDGVAGLHEGSTAGTSGADCSLCSALLMVCPWILGRAPLKVTGQPAASSDLSATARVLEFRKGRTGAYAFLRRSKGFELLLASLAAALLQGWPLVAGGCPTIGGAKSAACELLPGQSSRSLVDMLLCASSGNGDRISHALHVLMLLVSSALGGRCARHRSGALADLHPPPAAQVATVAPAAALALGSVAAGAEDLGDVMVQRVGCDATVSIESLLLGLACSWAFGAECGAKSTESLQLVCGAAAQWLGVAQQAE